MYNNSYIWDLYLFRTNKPIDHFLSQFDIRVIETIQKYMYSGKKKKDTFIFVFYFRVFF